MQQFFKLLSAESELTRLHVEIQRLLTYMDDEKSKIHACLERLHKSNPALALQVRLHGQIHSRFANLHRQRITAITRLEGFQHSNIIHLDVGLL